MAIPASATSATLSWTDLAEWDYFEGTQTLPRIYSVQLRDPITDEVLDTLHALDTGIAPGPGDIGWQTHSVDISAHIGSEVRVLFLAEIPEVFGLNGCLAAPVMLKSHERRAKRPQGSSGYPQVATA